LDEDRPHLRLVPPGNDIRTLLDSLPVPETVVSPGAAILQDLEASDGRPHEMTRNQLVVLREHLETNFWDFAYTIGGCNIMYRPIHGPVCELFERWGQPGWQRLMVQLPRGALKSSICTRTGALWRIVKDPNTTVAIFNEKIERVEKWITALQSIVAGNPYFQALWPEIIPPGIAKGDPRSRPRDWKWSSRELLFNRPRTGIPEASITAMSVGGASAGGHWEWLLHDDLISVEAQQSKVVMQAVKDWFDTSIYLGPSPELMNAWISCTRWHYDDVYEHARKYHGFRLYRRAAIEDGASSWPSRWSLEVLQKDQEQRPGAFSAQMQNQPTAGENTDFQPAALKRLTLFTNSEGVEVVRWLDHNPAQSVIDEEAPQDVPVSELSKILLVDPAPSTDTDRRQDPNARTAMVMRACDAWGRYYILDVWAGRERPIPEIRRMLDLCDRWSAPRFGVEEVNFSKLYAPFLTYMAEVERRERPGYTALKPGRREKGYRIAGFARSMAAGWEGCLDTCRAPLLEEMIPYPFGRTVDVLDAAAYARDPGVLGRPESPDEHFEREYHNNNSGESSGRDSVTGYLWALLAGGWLWLNCISLVA